MTGPGEGTTEPGSSDEMTARTRIETNLFSIGVPIDVIDGVHHFIVGLMKAVDEQARADERNRIVHNLWKYGNVPAETVAAAVAPSPDAPTEAQVRQQIADAIDAEMATATPARPTTSRPSRSAATSRKEIPSDPHRPVPAL